MIKITGEWDGEPIVRAETAQERLEKAFMGEDSDWIREQSRKHDEHVYDHYENLNGLK